MTSGEAICKIFSRLRLYSSISSSFVGISATSLFSFNLYLHGLLLSCAGKDLLNNNDVDGESLCALLYHYCWIDNNAFLGERLITNFPPPATLS